MTTAAVLPGAGPPSIHGLCPACVPPRIGGASTCVSWEAAKARVASGTISPGVVSAAKAAAEISVIRFTAACALFEAGDPRTG